jgi:uncharacterized repeat protein (TIGR03803 family)
MAECKFIKLQTPAEPLLSLITILTLTAVSWAVGPPTEKVLHQFTGSPDGSIPIFQPLIFDSAGNLYGTTVYGGLNNCGVVFELSPGQDGAWSETILYTFLDAPDGCNPWAGLTFDAAGNLYGTTQGGGDASRYDGGGTVYRLTPNQSGVWDESVIYTFGSEIATDPESSGVAIDKNGNLYGTTTFGGTYGSGAVYELAPQQDGTWTASNLYSFTGGLDGKSPYGGVTLDTSGNIYGTTYYGGGYGAGTVYKLTAQVGGTWMGSLLHTFTGEGDGGNPTGTVTLDAQGNVYGTVLHGRGFNENGEVFRVTPNGEKWEFSVLHGFSGGNSNGGYPNGDLVFDSVGNLYGTTQIGPGGGGTVFKLSPKNGSVKFNWFPLVYADGYEPNAGVVLDSRGNLYGMTEYGGPNGGCCGTVFEVVP